MNTYLYQSKSKLHYKLTSVLVAGTFVLSSIVPPSNVFAQVTPTTAFNLSVPGTMVPLTNRFNPPMVDGITIHADDPFKFDFLIGRGDHHLEGEAFTKEANKLIKYFLASLTVPEEELWVNLSPYEEDRIIPDSLSKTEMGRDLLAQDYMLKQLTASLMYPENELGQRFWNRIREKVQNEFGVSDLPVDTFNKVWIVPQDATVYESQSTVIVTNSHLKVMLESDYLAMENAKSGGQSSAINPQFSDNQLTAESRRLKANTREISEQIIREVIIPAIEKEVNEGETFANLRQVYNSMILATWYKQNLKESLLGQVYVDQNKVAGIDTVNEGTKDEIYQQYLKAFEVGVYNYIREEYDSMAQETIPRKYFAGGMRPLTERVVSSPATADEAARRATDRVSATVALHRSSLPAAPPTAASSPIEGRSAASSPATDVALEDLEIRSEDFTLESNIDLTRYPKAEAFIRQEVALLQTTSNKVVMVDEKDIDKFIEAAVDAGLAWYGDDGSVYYRSHSKDTARAIRPTIIASDDPTDKSERMNWEHTESALRYILNQQLGAHDGETTYGIAFVNGEVGTPTAFPGIQVTDNIHVVLSYFHLYRDGMGVTALEAIEALEEDYLQVSHATHPRNGTLDDVKRGRAGHPEDQEDRRFALFKPLKYLQQVTARIIKYGSNVVRLIFSGYGGNAIAAKKFALRFFNALGVSTANQSMAHQFFNIYYDEETEEVTGIAGSYPSMGGKSNEGAVKVPGDLAGKVSVYLDSEDLWRSKFLAKLRNGELVLLPKDFEERDAYLEANKEDIVEVVEMGRNLEHGTFLVAEGINDLELGRAADAIAKGGTLGVNLAYQFRWDAENGRLAVVRPWFERHSTVRPVQEVLAEYIAFREGTLKDADEGAGWHDWKGNAQYKKVGRLLMGRRINYDDVRFLERILIENEGFVDAILSGEIPYSDTLHATLSRNDYDRAVDIAKVVMTVIGKGQWNEANARISVPLKNYDNYIGNMDPNKKAKLGLNSKWGYRKDIQKWGGRSPQLEPLVRVQTSVTQGIYDGLFMRSLSTAATEGKPGQVGEAPFAQEPFYSTTIGRYTAHLLDRAKLTLMFFAHNNFFKESRTAEQKSRRGKFIWGGFSDQVRINRWLIKARKYLRGELSAEQAARFENEFTQTPVGLIPTSQASIFDGLRESEGGDLTEQDIIDLTTFDLQGWRAEVNMRTAYAVEKLKMDIPDDIRREHEKLVNALNEELSAEDQIVLPEAWTQAKPWEKLEEEKYAQAASSPVSSSPVKGSVSSPAQPVGGIDLDSEHLNLKVKRDGNGIPLPVSLQPIEIININGLIPVIINIAPVNVPLILGSAVVDDAEPRADTDTKGDRSLDSARNEYFDRIIGSDELVEMNS